MAKKTYKASWARIGNASGYRLSANFFKEHTQFIESDGLVEVLDDNTLLFRRQPTLLDEETEDELMLSLFLEFVVKQTLTHPNEVETYTEQMAADDDELLSGVDLSGV